LTREELLDSVNENVENKNMVKHMLATKAIMRALAKHLGGNEEEC
jgi:predicted hydrolase (HD superfamily)